MSLDHNLILTLNVGSSSLKFAVFRRGTPRVRVCSGLYERIGQYRARLVAVPQQGHDPETTPLEIPDHHAALLHLLDWLPQKCDLSALAAVGHRLVHGGPKFHDATLVTDEVLTQLHAIRPLAPLHLPGSLELLKDSRLAWPEVPHVACFDTAFHATMPAVARRYGLPRSFHDEGWQRYGFHGLSYQSVMDQLAHIPDANSHGRLVLAHLGFGSSVCAVVQGRSQDTTMGLTPNSGLIMGTRCGEVDPELILHLLGDRALSPAEVRRILNQESGMLGISGLSADVRELLAAEHQNSHAAEALESFCFSTRKAIAAMTASAGGLDELVFTGGIGTHSAILRERICTGLNSFGIQIDPERNSRSAALISPDHADVAVRVMTTDEESIIAMSTDGLISQYHEISRM